MKTTKLLTVLLPLAFVVGCAGTTQSGSQGDTGSRSTGAVIDDAAITAKVKTALLADPEISGLKINVDTAQGTVSLKGEIKTLALRKKAEGIVRGVAGVKSVNNQLVVTG
jgi:osmotically-inducible protein OsmY